MKNIDLLLVGGGRKQSLSLVRQILHDVKEVLAGIEIRALWLDVCGRWWLINDDDCVSCAWSGNKLVEVNTSLLIAGDPGINVKFAWPVASMKEMTPTGVVGMLEFIGVDRLGTNSAIAGVLQTSSLAEIVVKDIPIKNKNLAGAKKYYLCVAGRKNFLPSRLVVDNGGEYQLADDNRWERLIQSQMIDFVRKYQVNDLAVITIMANDNDWSVEEFELYPEIHRESNWVKIWKNSGLSYDSIIEKVWQEAVNFI